MVRVEEKTMAEDDSKNRKEEKLHPISRRDFALGSMAALGASIVGAATPPLSPEAKAMKLEIADDLRDLLDIRHIGEDDIRRVIDHAEKTGEKLYEPETGMLLSKLRVNEVYFYVEYAPAKEGYRILTAYSHRFKLGESD